MTPEIVPNEHSEFCSARVGPVEKCPVCRTRPPFVQYGLTTPRHDGAVLQAAFTVSPEAYWGSRCMACNEYVGPGKYHECWSSPAQGTEARRAQVIENVARAIDEAWPKHIDVVFSTRQLRRIAEAAVAAQVDTLPKGRDANTARVPQHRQARSSQTMRPKEFSKMIEELKPCPEMVALHVVFDGPPSHESGRFVECETPDGRSIKVGEWHERADGLWELRIPVAQFGEPAYDPDKRLEDARKAFSAIYNRIDTMPKSNLNMGIDLWTIKTLQVIREAIAALSHNGG